MGGGDLRHLRGRVPAARRARGRPDRASARADGGRGDPRRRVARGRSGRVARGADRGPRRAGPRRRACGAERARDHLEDVRGRAGAQPRDGDLRRGGWRGGGVQRGAGWAARAGPGLAVGVLHQRPGRHRAVRLARAHAGQPGAPGAGARGRHRRDRAHARDDGRGLRRARDDRVRLAVLAGPACRCSVGSRCSAASWCTRRRATHTVDRAGQTLRKPSLLWANVAAGLLGRTLG